MVRIIDLRTAAPDASAAAQGVPGSPHGVQRSLNSHGIAFISAVKDETQYQICLRYLDALEIPAGYTVEKIGVFGEAPMAECYQRAMEASTARYKIYLHVDTYVIQKAMLPELIRIFTTHLKLGLIGVVGNVRLPASGMWWTDEPSHMYGQFWSYVRMANSMPGIPLWPLDYLRRRRLNRWRSVASDYQPAVVVDGFFMATQYDIPWIHPQFGFDLYDHVQGPEFIKRGLEVGIARQRVPWCLHWGPLQEPSGEELRHRKVAIRDKTEWIRQLYPAFIGVPAQRLYEQHRRAAEDDPALMTGSMIGWSDTVDPDHRS